MLVVPLDTVLEMSTFLNKVDLPNVKREYLHLLSADLRAKRKQLCTIEVDLKFFYEKDAFLHLSHDLPHLFKFADLL